MTAKKRDQLLRGNFPVKKPVTKEVDEEDLTERFQAEALKRLGGSIAFVSKKKFLYPHDRKTSSPPQR